LRTAVAMRLRNGESLVRGGASNPGLKVSLFGFFKKIRYHASYDMAFYLVFVSPPSGDGF
jgi:hypothetical protein